MRSHAGKIGITAKQLIFPVWTMGYSVKIYSRIGELMQGVLPDASAFLVSGLASRRWYSEAVLEEGAMRPGTQAAGKGGERIVPGNAGGLTTESPALPPKASEALAILLRERGLSLPADVTIRLYSNIPRGKGLSSSSADVLSVLLAVNNYLEMGLCADDLYRIAALVEPTDPCLSDEIVLFHQHSGRKGAVIDLPPVSLLYFDAAPERRIDTLEIRRHWPRGAGDFFGWLLQRLTRAAAERDYELLFDSITYSAEYNQTMLPLPGFGDYRRLAAEAGAGLMVAHSGTIAGLLVPPEKEAALLPRLEALVPTPIYTEHYFSPYHRPAWRPYSAP
jgi:uncharacterized protein involved in propanediol utilization